MKTLTTGITIFILSLGGMAYAADSFHCPTGNDMPNTLTTSMPSFTVDGVQWKLYAALSQGYASKPQGLQFQNSMGKGVEKDQPMQIMCTYADQTGKEYEIVSVNNNYLIDQQDYNQSGPGWMCLPPSSGHPEACGFNQGS